MKASDLDLYGVILIDVFEEDVCGVISVSSDLRTVPPEPCPPDNLFPLDGLAFDFLPLTTVDVLGSKLKTTVLTPAVMLAWLLRADKSRGVKNV